MKKSAAATAPETTGSSIIYIQYQGVEISTQELVYRSKAEFDREHHLALINQLKLYVKPEEHAAYYLINDNFSGKIEF